MGTTDHTKIFIEKVLSLMKENKDKKVDLVLKRHPFPSIYATNATLLHYFAGYSNEKIIHCLLKRNYNINAQDSSRTTPLMVAVAKKNKLMIRVLLSAGADIMLLNNKKKNVLHMVFDKQNFRFSIGELFFLELRKKYSNEETAQILIDSGCLLYQACFFKNSRIIEYMLEHGLSANSTYPKNKQSALHLAVISEDVDTVRALLKHKANINALDSWGSTPLGCLYCFSSKHTQAKIKLFKILLNVDEVLVTSCDSSGSFQISRALTNGNRKTIRTILQSNVDFTAKDEKCGRSLLHYIALNQDPRVIDELKNHIKKFDINAVENSGLTALHTAVANTNVKMIQFLLDSKARSDCARNQYGYTPLYYAYSAFEPRFKDQCDQTVELLLQHNVETQLVFTDKNNEQITIFDAARKTNSLESVKPVVAHLALLEGIDVPISKIILMKIDSHPPLKRYLNKCRKLVKKEISGSVTLLKLLTSGEKKMALYSSNRDLMIKLIHLSYKYDLKFHYPYYYNTLKKRCTKGMRYRIYLNEIAAIISDVFKNRIDENHLVVCKIIDLINYDESLQQLYESSKVSRK